ncbi:MAG: hypothetical protein ACK462_06460, partial [Planctomyces sp.]
SRTARPMNAQRITLTDEDRLELLGRAASTARRNRPMGAVFFGVVLLGVALIFVFIGMARLASARSAAAEQARRTAKIRFLAGDVQAINNQLQGTEGRFDADPQAVSKLEAAAREVGMSELRVSDAIVSGSQNPVGFTRRKYTVTLTNQPAEGILSWLGRAPTEVRGLELSQFRVAPGVGTPDGKPSWSGTVEFLRWERTGR